MISDFRANSMEFGLERDRRALPVLIPVPESDMLCGLFCALSVITTLPGTGIVITALLRELGVGVVVVEVGRAV
jgi:Fe-S oxidoreductase